jgi:hypothetical protein
MRVPASGIHACGVSLGARAARPCPCCAWGPGARVFCRHLLVRGAGAWAPRGRTPAGCLWSALGERCSPWRAQPRLLQPGGVVRSSRGGLPHPCGVGCGPHRFRGPLGRRAGLRHMCPCIFDAAGHCGSPRGCFGLDLGGVACSRCGAARARRGLGLGRPRPGRGLSGWARWPRRALRGWTGRAPVGMGWPRRGRGLRAALGLRLRCPLRGSEQVARRVRRALRRAAGCLAPSPAAGGDWCSAWPGYVEGGVARAV